MLTPKQRRSIAWIMCAALGGTALRVALTGSQQKAHAFALLASSFILIPTLWRNCSLFGDIITTFETANREVWLTIDDGPNPQETPGILKILKKHNARATFFTIGRSVLRWPKLANLIVEHGHQIQNHTFSHNARFFWLSSPRVVQKEIALCNDAIFSATGIQPKQFRVPVGFANPFVHGRVERERLQMVGWSATGNDGIRHNPDNVIQKIFKSLSPGKIILLHESSLRSQPCGNRADTLCKLLRRLDSEGYKTTLPF
jgi:peptidoglycan/xylan/chitin deacetylase (PgdA/CDA1 family)